MIAVVASCAKYSDAWAPFIALTRHFWPDRKCALILAADVLDRPWQGDQAILAGRDLGWSANLLHALAMLSEEEILLLQEDFFLSGPVESSFVERMASRVARNDAACIRLMPCPGPDRLIDDDLGEVDRQAPYRTSCQAAIWKKSYLAGLLARTTDAASFEIAGTRIAAGLALRVLSVRRDRLRWPFPYVVSAISRGRWNPGALRLCDSLGIEVDRSRRPVEPEGGA